MKKICIIAASAFLSIAILSGCQKGHDDTGWEFAPNMYNPVGYEPYSQINKNPINRDGKNMREPVTGTVARRNYRTQFDSSSTDLMIYHLPKDSIAVAERVLKNPVPRNVKTEAEGKVLYTRYCQHCHGEEGGGNGPVGLKYAGVPNYKSDALMTMNDGHIFHVITYGKARMWAHGSQITPEERWKIVHYVLKLQGR